MSGTLNLNTMKLKKTQMEWVVFNQVAIAYLRKQKGENVLTECINEVNNDLAKESTATEKERKKIRRKHCSVNTDGTLIKHYSYTPATDKKPEQEIEHYSYTAAAEERVEAELEALSAKEWEITVDPCGIVPGNLTDQEIFVFKGVVIPTDYSKPAKELATNGSQLVHEGVN